MISFVVVACSQLNENLQQPEQNRPFIQLDTHPEGRANDPSVLASDELEETITFDPLVLFELTDIDLKKQVTELPYYSSGNIEFISDEMIRTFSKDQDSWRGDSVKTADLLTQNLVPAGIPTEKISYKVRTEEHESQTDKLTIVEKTVPNLGTFTINIMNPQEIGICFITKIAWQPAESESMQKLKGNMSEPLVIYHLWGEGPIDKDVRDIPNYQNSNIWFPTDEDIQSLNEGHSPWRTVPEIVAESYTRGLIPGNIPQDEISYEPMRKEEDLTTIAVIVPTFGIYEVTLSENFFEIITKITFQPE